MSFSKALMASGALFIGSLSLANDFAHMPKSFSYKDSKAVFADFRTADYDITYDSNTKTAKATAVITLETKEAGYPIFDCEATPTRVLIDQVETASALISTPAKETSVRVVEKMQAAGMHVLQVELPIQQLVEFTSAGVKSAFWMTDLKDRSYLERYLPANFVFDRVKMSFTLHFVGQTTAPSVYANGVVRPLDANTIRIDFPEYFTSLGLFFHTTPEGTTTESKFLYDSVDGRKLPVTIYTAKVGGDRTLLSEAKEKVLTHLKAMEADFGPFPHPSLTVYMAKGGMEYCGATMTSPGALTHELFHSYFARGMLQANGNAGWIDEAITVWHDKGFQSSRTLEGSSRMANHPYYTRATDTDAYGFGAQFIAFLNGKFSSKGGLKPFLRELLRTHLFTPITTEDFSTMMSNFYQTSGSEIDEIFKKYVYGDASFKSSVNTDVLQKISSPADHSPIHHQIMTIEELQKYL